MDRSSVQDWLDRYSAAWVSYDEADIRALFAADARYRYHPYDPDSDAVVGADAIVKDWVDPASRDAEGTYDSHYEAFAVEGDRAVAVGWSRYYEDASKSKLSKEYRNVYLLRFDAEGRCTDFTEFFMETPASVLAG
ncbi:MAG TPA: nuclear transport factor 2 family protein [Candidatus Limnocylindrales bacterium]|nr:nuclear transport factor 2 family protein [Candidatus Limnocylindrales bacterium]